MNELRGEYVRLVPVVRGQNDERGVLLFVLWQAIERAGDWNRLFWQFEDPRKGDLYHFLAYLTDPQNPAVGVIFEDVKTNALAGSFWFNCYRESDKSAELNIWVSPAYRGRPTREMGHLITKYAFEVLGLYKIFGTSPQAIVRNFGRKCGYVEMGHEDVYGHKVYRVCKTKDM